MQVTNIAVFSKECYREKNSADICSHANALMEDKESTLFSFELAGYHWLKLGYLEKFR